MTKTPLTLGTVVLLFVLCVVANYAYPAETPVSTWIYTDEEASVVYMDGTSTSVSADEMGCRHYDTFIKNLMRPSDVPLYITPERILVIRSRVKSDIAGQPDVIIDTTINGATLSTSLQDVTVESTMQEVTAESTE